MSATPKIITQRDTLKLIRKRMPRPKLIIESAKTKAARKRSKTVPVQP